MISKKVISFFTFGLFLIVAGAILKFAKNEQGDIIMAIGLIFESLALLLFAWNKVKK